MEGEEDDTARLTGERERERDNNKFVISRNVWKERVFGERRGKKKGTGLKLK